MVINIKDLKNKIIYRANYRGTKEMDNLLGSFTKKYIDQFDLKDLLLLSELLNYDDENLYRFNQGLRLTIEITDNKVSEMFKNFKYANE
ncbi:MAG: succinate dehydrogenase assembly factor 2 [Flavobacteriaceae bacterium TMED238]|jgi:antitoxin CptB|nr:MAG: succinate dehydrogenase assembly factor 2 [Flavobacteriaceae bacterium TMED238]|tara:strand:- start:36 stop:302 length:267 start_codon:yes stop_codon:yes gene_type:complete